MSSFDVVFYSVSDARVVTVTESVGLSGPDAAERGDQTGVFAVSITGLVPVGTRFVQFELAALRRTGDFNDGYADDLSFVLNPAATPVPEPASLVMLGMAVAGTAAARRRRAR